MIFIDANIVLELVLPGRAKQVAVIALLGEIAEPAISMLTVHLVWHFGRLQGLNDGLIEKVLADYEVLDLTAENYIWALANEAGKDFEDALQVAVALSNNCEGFLTLDRPLVKRYSKLALNFVSPA